MTTATTFGVVIAIAAVFVGVYAMNDQTSSMSSANSNAYMVGHITTIVKDSDGNIQSYLQSDNLIVNRGESCALTRLFSNSTIPAVGGCSLPGATGNSFSVVSLSNSNATVADADTGVSTTGETNFNATSGMAPKKASTVVLTAASGTTPAKAVITAVFTNTDVASKTVGKAGLQNATHGNPTALFAAQKLPSVITLAQNNELTVEWTINIGGTTTFN